MESHNILRKFIFISMFFLVIQAAFSQADHNKRAPIKLEILNYSKQLKVTQIIRLKLVNLTGRQVFYSVGYELKLTGKREWDVLSCDIYNSDTEKVSINKLKPGEVKFINFQISNKPWKQYYPDQEGFLCYGHTPARKIKNG